MNTTTEEQKTNGTTTHAQPAAMVKAETEGAISAFSSAGNFESAQRMALALASSSLVPQSYQGRQNIPNVLIAMELASRVGASVFMVMQNLDIIHGRPGWRAQFLIATANASGRFSPLRFRWEGTPGKDDWGCRAVAKERESGEECIGALITMGLAKAEGWASKQGSKWKTMPEQMMMYRAAAFWTRVYAPEISLGMQTAEELSDVSGAQLGPMPAAIVPGDPKALEAAIVAETASAPVVPAAPASEPQPTGDSEDEA